MLEPERTKEMLPVIDPAKVEFAAAVETVNGTIDAPELVTVPP